MRDYLRQIDQRVRPLKLFSSQISANYLLHYDHSGWLKELKHWMPQFESVQEVHEKRELDFYFSRYSLMRAASQMEFYLGESELTELSSTKDLYQVSISHTRGLVASAFSASQSVVGIGVDAEAVRFHWTQRHRDKILTRSELIRDYGPEDLTIVFSAKESLFKCFHPICNVFFGFRDAEVLELNHQDSTFTYRLNRNLGAGLSCGLQGKGKFCFVGDYVLTGVEYHAQALERELGKNDIFAQEAL